MLLTWRDVQINLERRSKKKVLKCFSLQGKTLTLVLRFSLEMVAAFCKIGFKLI